MFLFPVDREIRVDIFIAIYIYIYLFILLNTCVEGLICLLNY